MDVSVEKLDVYILAEKLADFVWTDFDTWSEKVQKTVGHQVIRSADSISANFAEGFGRYSSNDRAKFYFYSRGSFEETKSWLRKLIRRKIVTDEQIKNYEVIINELGPKLNAYISKTRNTKYE